MTFKHGEQSGEADYVVIAAGRGPDIEGLGLDTAGVALDERGLIAGRRRDAHQRPGHLCDR